MYISANKVNVTHSYTPQQGSTSPSTAGHKEASGPPSWSKLKQISQMKAHTPPNRKLSESSLQEGRELIFTLLMKKGEALPIVQKPLYLPDR